MEKIQLLLNKLKKRQIPICLVFITMLLFQLPWLVGFFPGIITDDSCGQLLMCIWGNYNDHHPMASSLLMYSSLLIGNRLFHSDNVGIFIYVLTQMLFQTFAFSLVIELFKRKKTTSRIILFTMFFYCIFPFWGNSSILFCKDIGYGISCLICLITVQMCFTCKNVPDKGMIFEKALLIISLIGMMVFRHEGVIISVFILVLLFFSFPSKRALVVIASAGVIGFLIINSFFINLLHVEKGSVREALSLPILITSAYCDRYPGDLSTEDTNLLKELFDIADVEELSNYTNYDISDDLKAKMVYSPEKRALLEYGTFLLKKFIKHPGLYFEMVYRHASGYINPFDEKYEDIDSFLYILGGEKRTDEYLSVYFSGNIGIRNKLRNYMHLWDDSPVAGVLFNPGFYTCLLLLDCILLLASRKRRHILYFLPAFLTVLILALSPLNGSVRYAIPLMITMPVYFELAVSQFASIFTKIKSDVSKI